jgi:hypothetical protein
MERCFLRPKDNDRFSLWRSIGEPRYIDIGQAIGGFPLYSLTQQCARRVAQNRSRLLKNDIPSLRYTPTLTLEKCESSSRLDFAFIGAESIAGPRRKSVSSIRTRSRVRNNIDELQTWRPG